MTNKWLSFSIPTDILGLQLWLDASDTDTITSSGGAVSQWDDKSGNSNNATQGTGSAQPTTGASTQNGENIIDFDGGDTFVLPSALYSIPNGSNTIFAVTKRTSEDATLDAIVGMQESSSTRYILSFDATSGVLDFRSNNIASGAITISGATNTDFQIVRGRRNGTTQAISFNGSAEQTNTSGADENGVDAAHIASLGGSGNFLVGSIAEMLVYNRSLT